MNKTSCDLKQGIKAHFIKTDLYKTDLTCIIITTPLKRETVTLNALIPFMLRRGTKRLPNQSLLNKEFYFYSCLHSNLKVWYFSIFNEGLNFQCLYLTFSVICDILVIQKPLID